MPRKSSNNSRTSRSNSKGSSSRSNSRSNNARGRAKSSSRSNNSTNKRHSVENMKYEIANEFGVSLGGDSSSKANGSVGGEITKRLVQRGIMKNSSRSNKNNKSR